MSKKKKYPSEGTVRKLPYALEDLAEPDRDWATAMAQLVGISLHDAAMRIRRVRRDPKLWAAFVQTQDDLGDGSIVTNVEWGGPNLDRIDVSVMAAPTPIVVGGVPKYIIGTDAAKSAMRTTIALHEHSRVHGHGPRTALGLMTIPVETKHNDSKSTVTGGGRIDLAPGTKVTIASRPGEEYVVGHRGTIQRAP